MTAVLATALGVLVVSMIIFVPYFLGNLILADEIGPIGTNEYIGTWFCGAFALGFVGGVLYLCYTFGTYLMSLA